MKRIYTSCIILLMILGVSFNSQALKVTLEWDNPGSIEIRLGSISSDPVALSANQTSYVFDIPESYGYIYASATQDWVITGATDGTKTWNVSYYTNPPSIIGGLYSDSNGTTIKINCEKVVRNDSFTFDVVNGAEYINATFRSGYTLDLQDGSHTYKFNPTIDGPLSVRLTDVGQAYKFTLNGVDVPKNHFYALYEDINIQPNDKLEIQLFEGAAPTDCTLTFDYGEGMEGCVLNIYNKSLGNFMDFNGKSLTVKADTELRVNFVEDDYTFSSFTLNGTNITNKYSQNSLLFTVTEENSVLKIEGTAVEYGTIDFTGYIINGNGVQFMPTYEGSPIEVAEGEAVTKDIVVKYNDGLQTLTMPASETLKYTVPVSEKGGKVFFAPKAGYYISNLLTVTPDGTVEQHSGNSSMTADLDGIVFYMVVEKLPASYTANVNLTGDDFFMRVVPTTTLADVWSNPGAGSYKLEQGDNEISFLPGYGTPIVFGFSGDEGKTPGVYLDGAEVTGVLNEDSNATEYSITPYYPVNETDSKELHSSIVVYNSYTARPQMSGASLVLEEDGEAEFFYSPILHVANPDGQVVISGTEFTVRPKSTTMFVIYKNQVVDLNEKGEFVFNATGNARNNIVKVTTRAESGIEAVDGNTEAMVTVYSIDGKILLQNVPAARLGELEKGLYIVNGKKVNITK